MIGAISTLVSSLPITAYQNFITKTGLKPILALPTSFTTNILAILAVFFIAYRLSEVFEKDGATAGLIALICFFILTPLGQLKSGDSVSSVITFDWLGAKGLFVAIIVGLLAGRIYVFIVDKRWTIKMPDGVPPTIGKSFAGLIPGFIIVVIFLVINEIFKATSFGSMHQFIYTFVQTPLEGLGGSLLASIIAMFASHFLWVFGIHGMMVVFSVMMPIWLSLDMANLSAYQAGLPLPNVLGGYGMLEYVTIGGSGATLGLNILMLRAKSKRYRMLGRLAIPAGICCINEPIIFGTPVVLNPTLVIPFISAPLANLLIAYGLTYIGIVARPMGTQLPLGVPPVIQGFLQGDWTIAALQFVLIFVDLLIYYPFFKILDNAAAAEEGASEVNA